MPLIIRLGDTSYDHGGQVVTSAQKTLAEGILVARVGDMFDCPIHGLNPIAQGSPNTFAEGKQIARHGDITQCEAHLQHSAVKTPINGP